MDPVSFAYRPFMRDKEDTVDFRHCRGRTVVSQDRELREQRHSYLDDMKNSTVCATPKCSLTQFTVRCVILKLKDTVCLSAVFLFMTLLIFTDYQHKH